jgi:ribosomal protein S27AE
VSPTAKTQPPKMLGKSDTKRLIEAMKSHTHRMCPRCSHEEKWIMLRAFVTLEMQPDPENPVTPAGKLPTVTAMCNHCGYLALHALAPLGLEVE